MFLSQLKLDARSRFARRDVGDPYQMHRTLWSAFPEGLAECGERILWRVDTGRNGEGNVLVQSKILPEWGKLLHKYPDYLREPAEHKLFEPDWTAGQLLRFRLRANASSKRDGKRRAIIGAEAQRDWLVRTGKRRGFAVGEVELIDEGTRAFRKRERRIQLSVVQFDGLLQIRSVPEFGESMQQGIGHSKGFGLGLLSVAAT